MSQLKELPGLGRRQIREVLGMLQKSMAGYLYIYDFDNDIYEIADEALGRFKLPASYFNNAVERLSEVVYPKDYPEVIKDLDMCFKGIQNTHNMEYRWYGTKKEIIWINCRGTVVNTKNGKLLVGCVTEIGKRAKVDNLTGLRREERFILDTKGMLRENPEQISYFMRIGIDNFKEINEKYGMEAGDQVLKELSDCIVRVVEPDVNIYRLVADEFMIVAMDDETEEDAERTYLTLRDEVVRLTRDNDYERFFTISVGLLEGPFVGKTSDEILKLSEFALNEAKRKGRNRIERFEEEQYNRYIRNLNIRKVIRRDIANDFHGFSVYFQPIVWADTFEIASAEALLRWTSEEYGCMPPSEFIPIMEESGLIIPAGRFVLEKAAQACREWQKDIPLFQINVNLSYVQMHKSDFITDLKACVERLDIRPDSIMIELTESGYIETDLRIRNMLDNICDFQVRLAIDDFGTGYSNIRYLKEIQAQVVKIDRSFVMKALENEHDFTLITYITKMVHSLGLLVCMEGIETQEEMERIKLAEPDLIQGFLFGKPMDKDSFERMLR